MCFLDEIQTMFPQLANQPSSVLPADMFTDHLFKKPKINGFEKNQKREIEGRTVSLYYTVFWLFTRLLTLCRSLVFGLHIFLLNNFLRRV